MAPTEHRQERMRPRAGTTELFLVRHGASAPEVEGQSFPLVDGHGDPPLAPEGHEQAERVGTRLADVGLDAIYVTTLTRTQQTAAPLADRTGLTPIVEPDLREVFLGEWEGGLFRKHVAEGHPAALQLFTEQRWDAIPGGEPADAFRDRVAAGLARIIADNPGRKVAAFVHGGVIAEALRQVTESGRAFAFLGADNGSISHVWHTDGRWVLRRFNDTGHLDPPFDLPPLDDTGSALASA